MRGTSVVLAEVDGHPDGGFSIEDAEIDRRTIIAQEFATAVGPWATLARSPIPVVARTHRAVAARYGLLQSEMGEGTAVQVPNSLLDQLRSDDPESQPIFARVRGNFFHYLGAAAVFRSMLIEKDEEDEDDVFGDIVPRYYHLALENLVDARMTMREEIDWLSNDRSLARVQPDEKFNWLRRAALLAANDLLYGQEGFTEAVVAGELSGLVAEHKVYDAVNMGGYNCRYASPREEIAGIDIVAERGNRRLNLQVMGRKGSQKELKIRKPGSAVPQVYIGTGDDFYPLSLSKSARDELIALVRKRI